MSDNEEVNRARHAMFDAASELETARMAQERAAEAWAKSVDAFEKAVRDDERSKR